LSYLPGTYVSNSIDALCEQVWGCGGKAAQVGQEKQKEWEKHAVTKEQNRKV